MTEIVRQIEIQYGIEDDERSYRKNRSRIISQYNESLLHVPVKLGVFKKGEVNLLQYIEKEMSQGKNFRWLDAFAGNGLAQLSAKSELKKIRKDIDKLETISVDILPRSQEEIESALHRYKEALFPVDDYSRQFEPQFIQSDILDFIDEKFDLITVVEGIYYHPDPVKVIEHLCNLLNQGGLLMMSGVDAIKIYVTPTEQMSIGMYIQTYNIEGVQVIQESNYGQIILKKTKKIYTKLRDNLQDKTIDGISPHHIEYSKNGIQPLSKFWEQSTRGTF